MGCEPGALSGNFGKVRKYIGQRGYGIDWPDAAMINQMRIVRGVAYWQHPWWRTIINDAHR